MLDRYLRSLVPVSVLAPGHCGSGAMVDRTSYDPDCVPELSLRQVFGRNKLPQALCRVVADKKLLSIEQFAMLGDTIAVVKDTLKVIIGDDSLLGPDQAARELALTSLASIWKSCSTLQEHFASRRAKMEEDPTKVPEIPGDDHAEFREQFVSKHPDVLLPHHREPHRKFVERIQRDYLVHGSVPFYEVGEMRTRSEQIAQKSGLSKNAEDLLKVVMVDQPVSAVSEQQVMDKLPGEPRSCQFDNFKLIVVRVRIYYLYDTFVLYDTRRCHENSESVNSDICKPKSILFDLVPEESGINRRLKRWDHSKIINRLNPLCACTAHYSC